MIMTVAKHLNAVFIEITKRGDAYKPQCAISGMGVCGRVRKME